MRDPSRFETEFKSLLRANFQVPDLNPDTDISIMDSLAVMETVTLAEEYMDISLTFDRVRRMKKYSELVAAIEVP